MHANKNGFFCEWYEFYAGTTFLGTKVDPRSIQPAIPPHPASWPPWGSDRFIALALVRHGRHLPPMSSAAGGGVLRDPGQPGGACLRCAGTGSTARPPSSPRCCRRMPWPGLCGPPTWVVWYCPPSKAIAVLGGISGVPFFFRAKRVPHVQ